MALLIIVAPVVIVLTTSFTEGRSLKFPPTGFSLQWYEALFDPSKSRQIHRAVQNSLEVAAWSTGFGILFGSMASLGIARNAIGWRGSPTACSCRRWSCRASPSAWRR